MLYTHYLIGISVSNEPGNIVILILQIRKQRQQLENQTNAQIHHPSTWTPVQQNLGYVLTVCEIREH